MAFLGALYSCNSRKNLACRIIWWQNLFDVHMALGTPEPFGKMLIVELSNLLDLLAVSAAHVCCIILREKNHTVVHGGDFTSMGVKSELDWLETEFAKHFELKIRGRLGEDCSGPQEIRILNRIVTLGADGLTYEADPRHVDLLSSSLGLTSANSVATPGVKDPNPDYDSQKENEPENLPLETPGQHGTRIVAGITTDMVSVLQTGGTSKTVTFSDDVSFSNVTAYSNVYGIHPRFIAATCDGWKTVSSHADPFTCKSGAIMQQRHAKLYDPVSRNLAASHRQSILKRYISSLRANLRMMD